MFMLRVILIRIQIYILAPILMLIPIQGILILRRILIRVLLLAILNTNIIPIFIFSISSTKANTNVHNSHILKRVFNFVNILIGMYTISINIE